MSQIKIVETFTGQSVSDFGTKLRNCAKLEFRKSGIGQFCTKGHLRMIAQIVFFRAKLKRKERKILRFVPQKLRKSFANGNPNQKSIDFPIFLSNFDPESKIRQKRSKNEPNQFPSVPACTLG